MTQREPFRALFDNHFPLVTPMAHDAMSARLITEAGFPAVAIGGLAMLASHYALPDLGIAGLGEMADGARSVMRGTHLPCGIDGDDGYGDLKSVARTVEVFEGMGIGSIIFEDQNRVTKRPGETAARNIIPVQDMVDKLKAALSVRQNRDNIILARCDAFKSEGLDAALSRADRYLKAGVDGIFISGVSNPEDLARVGGELRGTIQIAVVSEQKIGASPSPKEFYDMGYSQVVFPHIVLSQTVAAMRRAISDVKGIAAGQIAMGDANVAPDVVSALQISLGADRWYDIEGLADRTLAAAGAAE